MVPHEHGGGEADDVALVLESPAHVHVVAGRPVGGVEAADAGQVFLAVGHVAARDVLGDLVGQKDVGRRAGRHGHAGGGAVVVGRGQVGAAHGHETLVGKGPGHVVQPVRVHVAVGVGVGDNGAPGGVHADVAGGGQAQVGLVDNLDVGRGGGVAVGDLAGGVGGAVVDHDDFEVGVVDLGEGGQAAVHGGVGVVGAHDHRDKRRVGRQMGQLLAVDVGHGLVGRLLLAHLGHDAELPVLDQVAAGEPFVGPGEDHGAGHAQFKGGVQLPGQGLGHMLLVVADGVHAEFGQDQRQFAGHVLQALHIGAEGLLVVEVDVKRQEVQKGQAQVFRGRVVGVGDQAFGIFLAHDVGELFEELLNLARAVPTHDVAGDLVADEPGQDGRMAGQGGHGLADGLLDVFFDFPLVEEAQVLGPGHADHDAHAVAGGDVQEAAGRHVVDADGVDAGAAHEFEVMGHGVVLGQGFAPGVFRERAVGDALDEELVFPGKQIPAPGADAREGFDAGESFFDLEHNSPSPWVGRTFARFGLPPFR